MATTPEFAEVPWKQVKRAAERRARDLRYLKRYGRA